MKKIWVILAVLTIISVMPVVSSISIDEKQKIENKYNYLTLNVDWTGYFSGGIGFPNPDSEEPRVIGYMNGLYKLRNRGGFFIGNITSVNQSKTGSIRGIFGLNFLIGKISGDKGSLPFVGFIGFRQNEKQMIGRAISIIGPPVYFLGNYSEF
jgi:hypothetical protein